jgi:HAD superfamily hydrolase (TIGR01490 family)
MNARDDEDGGDASAEARALIRGAVSGVQARRAIAFFDLDKTVLHVNSATLWIRRELRAGHITRIQALRASFWVALYGVGFARMEDVITGAVRTLKGKRERDIIDHTLEFWRGEVSPTIRPGARLAIDRHRGDGDLLFLLTSSTNYMSAPCADELGFDGFLANRFDVEGGLFTGATIEPICYGHGKVAHAQAVCDKLNVRLEDCAFYTDSYSDRPMLDVVGRPVAVNPDPRLRRYAKQRGWPVEDWGQAPRALLKGP